MHAKCWRGRDTAPGTARGPAHGTCSCSNTAMMCVVSCSTSPPGVTSTGMNRTPVRGKITPVYTSMDDTTSTNGTPRWCKYARSLPVKYECWEPTSMYCLRPQHAGWLTAAASTHAIVHVHALHHERYVKVQNGHFCGERRDSKAVAVKGAAQGVGAVGCALCVRKGVENQRQTCRKVLSTFT